MTDCAVIGEARFLDRKGKCRNPECGTTAYTVRELNCHDGQAFRCYACFDRARDAEALALGSDAINTDEITSCPAPDEQA